MDAQWAHAYDALLYRKTHEPPRTKVAGFDLDGTLLRWTCAGWPNAMTDYALWSAQVPVLMKSLHADGYKIVIFGNRSGIKGALTGKNALKTHSLVNWIASLVPGVPLHGLFATRKNDGKHEGARFFKPNIGMWEAMEQLVNDKVKVDPAASFYVGDMAGREGDPGSSDKEWAANVGASRGVTVRRHGIVVKRA